MATKALVVACPKGHADPLDGRGAGVISSCRYDHPTGGPLWLGHVLAAVHIDAAKEFFLEGDAPERLFVTSSSHTPTCDLGRLVHALGRIDSTPLPGLTLLSSLDRDLLHYAKIILENADLDLCVATKWQDVPVAHFNGLPLDLTEDEFRELFGDVLPGLIGVFKFGLRADATESTFNCSFETDHDTWKAIEELSYGEVSGKEIRVSHYIPSEGLQQIRGWNIRIGGIPCDMNHAELASCFRDYGRVLSLSTKPDKATGKLICSVQYIDHESVRRATDGIPQDFVGLWIVEAKESGIAVYNFSPQVTDSDVKKLFPAATEIKIEPPKERDGRRVVWLGFPDTQERDRALLDGERHFSDSLRLFCVPKILGRNEAFAAVKEKDMQWQEQNTICVKRIPPSARREDLVRACRRFGDMNSCLLVQPAGRPPFGIVAFTDPAAFRRALAEGFRIGTAKASVEEYRVKTAKTPRRV
jgi:hypothetical protein